MEKSNIRFEHFLDYNIWCEAIKLLEAQIERKQHNKYYNNLSFFYYEKLASELELLKSKEYYNAKIANNLFYGLEKEFFAYNYTIPKTGVGLRKYAFFSLPMQVLYYAIGLYLVKLCQKLIEYNESTYHNINSFYGGKLYFDKNKLVLNPKNLYYKNHYDEFKGIVLDELEKLHSDSSNKVIIKLDIQNYFENIDIGILLNGILENNIPEKNKKMNFDQHTIDMISFYFKYLGEGEIGIPQSYSNIVSSYIGYLYLVFGDYTIYDSIYKIYEQGKIKYFRISRYIDDTYIILDFEEGTSKQIKSNITYDLINAIAEDYYTKFNLRFNKKLAVYLLEDEEDEEIEEIKKGFFSFYDGDEIFIEQPTKKEKKKKKNKKKDKKQEKTSTINYLPDLSALAVSQDDSIKAKKDIKAPEMFMNLMKLLPKLKDTTLVRVQEQADNPETKEVLQYVYDRNVFNLMSKPGIPEKLEEIFENFDWDLVRIFPKVFTILISLTKNAKEQFQNFWSEKQRITSFEADIIINYLAQNNFQNEDLLKKVATNPILKPIVSEFLNPVAIRQLDYFDLPHSWILHFSKDPNVYEQIRLRVYHQLLKDYSIALNHLLNELHAICRLLDPEASAKGNRYDANCVVSFLTNAKLPPQNVGKIRNLFDRRNKNPVSHPGGDNLVAWGVSESEYLDYYKAVKACLISLNKKFPLK
ncbi:AbiA family abortive infection protein [Sphingobacteriales bacterium UPWRP_1]|nr:hypothetical protein BVG80_10185 [Sphingobacteriales bacterium TSM_CSM]PSJ73784.1 AbiA family abortive infection protein [Sphingobacteriales bacterium UPWRP_1]